MAAVGKHRHQESRIQRRQVRRGTRRSRHRQHDAAGDDGCVSRSWQAARVARGGRRRGARHRQAAGGGGNRSDRGRRGVAERGRRVVRAVVRGLERGHQGPARGDRRWRARQAVDRGDRLRIAGQRGVQGSRQERISRTAVEEGCHALVEGIQGAGGNQDRARLPDRARDDDRAGERAGVVCRRSAQCRLPRRRAARDGRFVAERRAVRRDISGQVRLSETSRARFDRARNYPRARSQHRHHQDAVRRREQDRRDHRDAVALQRILRAREGEVVESRRIAFRRDHRPRNQARGAREGK